MPFRYIPEFHYWSVRYEYPDGHTDIRGEYADKLTADIQVRRNSHLNAHVVEVLRHPTTRY